MGSSWTGDDGQRQSSYNDQLANLLVEYAQWVEPVAEGVVCHLPGHNSSCKRAILLDYGSDLEAMLEAESILHWDLQAKGYRLYLEPAAKTHHLNVSLLSSTGLLRFYGGRSFATARARDWSLLGRLLYAGGAPLIPLVRLWRIIGELRKPGRECSLLPRILPALVFVLTFGAAGEMIGYVFGAGNSVKKLSDLEFHRSRHLAERDRQVYTDR